MEMSFFLRSEKKTTQLDFALVLTSLITAYYFFTHSISYRTHLSVFILITLREKVTYELRISYGFNQHLVYKRFSIVELYCKWLWDYLYAQRFQNCLGQRNFYIEFVDMLINCFVCFLVCEILDRFFNERITCTLWRFYFYEDHF